MRVLLDTHVFIWLDTAPEKLSTEAHDVIFNRKNLLLLSMTSVWEMQIKVQLGKLSFNHSLPSVIESQQEINKIKLLPIVLPHIFQLDGLQKYHRDPFDRLLIAQSQVERLVLLTDDEQIQKYSVNWLW